jgi:hypothetical protein
MLVGVKRAIAIKGRPYFLFETYPVRITMLDRYISLLPTLLVPEALL